MGVHYPPELILPIVNVSVASGTDPLHLTCFSQSGWDDSPPHMNILNSLITWYCVAKGLCWSGPNSSVLQSHPTVGSEVPVEPCGRQCPALFFSSPAWEWECWCSVSPSLPDAVGALVKSLCCENLLPNPALLYSPKIPVETQLLGRLRLQVVYSISAFSSRTPQGCL